MANPFLNIPPSGFIREELERRGMRWQTISVFKAFPTVEDVDARILKDPSSMSALAHNCCIQFGQTKKFWMNIFTNWRDRELVKQIPR